MGDVPAAKLFLQYVDDFTVDEQKQIQNNINVTPEELSVILGNLKNKKNLICQKEFIIEQYQSQKPLS